MVQIYKVINHYKIQTNFPNNMSSHTYLYLISAVLMVTSINSYTCSTIETSIKIGESSVVCLHMIYNDKATNVNTTQTYAFRNTVDKFSALKVANIKNKLNGNTGRVYAVVQMQNSGKYLQMLLYDPSAYSGIYRALFSVVINVQTGNVTQITDDNADCSNCNTADTQVCNQNTKFKCFSKAAKYPTTTDPRIFISWIGTDISGEYMLSHTKRLSRFTQYSVGSIYNSAISAFTS